MDEILLYVSAAPDLSPEREILGRAITTVPVTLGWRIVQSPLHDDPVDWDAIAKAEVHLLLLGADIRAPIGLEWVAARRAGRKPALFLKQDILRTPAAQSFVRFIADQATWQPFTSGTELCFKVLGLLADHILEHAAYYGLSPQELARLRAWRAALDLSSCGVDEVTRGGAGESGLVLSPERYVPSEGVLLRGAPKQGGSGSKGYSR